MAIVRASTVAAARSPERDQSDTPTLQLCDLAIAYRGHTVLSGVDLSTSRGEIIAVVGPSGSGKSSLLRCVAGFLDPVAGAVCIDGELVADQRTSLSPERRRIGFVFQHYALWPHMTVRENVAYPWRTRQVASQERERRADELLEQVGLAGFGDRAPGTLSGGQQQRVALARGLAGDPRLLLLDEPLSSVDAARRDELQLLIGDVVRARGLTTLITTHDQREAMTLADRIIVLGGGTVAQCATPLDLYTSPANGFVARFMGALNVFDVDIVSQSGDRLVAKTAGGQGTIVARVSTGRAGPRAVLVARPESIRLGAEGSGDQDGEVIRSVLSDGRSEIRLRVGGITLRAFESGVPSRVAGERVGLVLEGCLVLDQEDEVAPS